MKKMQFVLKSFVVMGTLSQRVFASDSDEVGGDRPRGEKTVSSLSLSCVSKPPEDLSFAELVALVNGDDALAEKEESVPKYSPRIHSPRIYLPRNLIGPF